MNEIAMDILMHVGVSKLDGAPGPGSGRYPLGSGENPNQHQLSLHARIKEMRKSGMGDGEIAKALGYKSSRELRALEAMSKHEEKNANIAKARDLKEHGYSTSEIGRRMGVNESTIRGWLDEEKNRKSSTAINTADFLEQQIKEKGIIDVGDGVEKQLHISKEMLEESLIILEQRGYIKGGGRREQVTNKGKFTTLKVIGPPDMEKKDVFDPEKVHQIMDYVSQDGGDTFDPKWVYPASLDSKRLQIVYAEDGGLAKDGLIELRRGNPDLDLGGAHYSQVRILVDGDRYLKGMAVYNDDLPPGVDVRFNTNKKRGTDMRDVLKKIKDDPDNPFGSLIKPMDEGGQYYYEDSDGNKKLGLINKTRSEGDWDRWSRNLPSQFLSKQNFGLIKQQLNMTMADSDAELKDILEVNNPTVRKKLLLDYAESCDSAAVHLKAASLPRQAYQVIMPLTTIRDNEVYAPNFKNGETVALIRYPHGGTFEIPILKVNNKNKEGIDILSKNPSDAVGINSKVAERLSGADFDGDTVMVVPCNESGKPTITSTRPLKGLEGFDPKTRYGGKEPGTFTQMTKKNTQREMGIVSNLITDMTIKGASEDELARAVRHSMVVIDAEKHKLDYKQSYKDNRIAELKKIYQGYTDPVTGEEKGGASTLISRAGADASVPKRKGSPQIDPKTGKVSYKLDEDRFYTDKNGKVKERMQKSTQMMETDDAFTLSSGTKVESAYATYANHMKANANNARKEALATPRLKQNKTAKETYKMEVKSLLDKLRISELNAPKEREAQRLATLEVEAKKKAYPDLEKSEIKKIEQRAITKARAKVGAKRNPISVTDREWLAIQSGGVSDTQLTRILRFADMDDIRKKATPRASNELSPAKQSRVKAMLARGYTNEEIASALGVSSSTVQKYGG